MSRNSDVLADFVRYCEEHPDERFWQALRNWSGWMFIYGAHTKPPRADAMDTYYREGK